MSDISSTSVHNHLSQHHAEHLIPVVKAKSVYHKHMQILSLETTVKLSCTRMITECVVILICKDLCLYNVVGNEAETPHQHKIT